MPTHTEQDRKQPGRPLGDPWYRASENFRGLVSPATQVILEEAMQIHGLTQSNLVRYGLYLVLKKNGLAGKIDPEKDNTWKDLLEAGLI